MLDRFDTWLLLAVFAMAVFSFWKVLQEQRKTVELVRKQLADSQAQTDALRARLSALQSHRGEIIDFRIDMAKAEAQRFQKQLAEQSVILEQYRKQIEKKTAAKTGKGAQ